MSFDWWYGLVKTYLLIAVLLLHHDLVINKHSKYVSITKSLLWLPVYLWRWIELVFGVSFASRLKRKEKAKVEKVEPPVEAAK